MTGKLLCYLVVFAFATASAQTTPETNQPGISTGFGPGTYPPIDNESSSTDQTNLYGIQIPHQLPSSTQGASGNLTSTSTEEENGEVSESESSNGNYDYDEDGKADDLADYVMKKVGQLLASAGLTGGEQEEGVGTEAATVSPESNVTIAEEADDPELKNCSAQPTLDSFCEVPGEVQEFFDYDLSVHGIFNSLFRPDVIDALKVNCTPGNWCLSDQYHQVFMQTSAGFLFGLVCFCHDNLRSILLYHSASGWVTVFAYPSF